MKKAFVYLVIASAVLVCLYPLFIELAKMYDNDMSKARNEAKTDIANKLKTYGDSSNKIAEITGLSIREVDAL